MWLQCAFEFCETEQIQSNSDWQSDLQTVCVYQLGIQMCTNLFLGFKPFIGYLQAGSPRQAIRHPIWLWDDLGIILVNNDK